jgi:hypothetical protein
MIGTSLPAQINLRPLVIGVDGYSSPAAASVRLAPAPNGLELRSNPGSDESSWLRLPLQTRVTLWSRAKAGFCRYFLKAR